MKVFNNTCRVSITLYQKPHTCHSYQTLILRIAVDGRDLVDETLVYIISSMQIKVMLIDRLDCIAAGNQK